MKPAVSVKQVTDKTAALRRAMRSLTEQDVLIGVPEDKAAREAAGDTGISNAYLAYIHEHGVPEHNLPARPALLPGINDILDEAVAIMEGMAGKALDGDAKAVVNGLNKIGLLGQNAVRARFVSNEWEPLKDATLDRRPRTGQKVDAHGEVTPVYGKSRRERGALNPLIDTSGLRKSYTYVVRKRGTKAEEIA